MSWFTNLFKRKPKRTPARDHRGRFLADENGNIVFTDSPKEEIQKAIALAKKREEKLLAYFKSQELPTSKKCGCEGGKCACANKPVAKKAPAKSTEKKTAIKKDIADAPVAKKKSTPKKK